MPDQENISSDTARCVLRHIMFGVLFVLIILNWSVHRPMDYAVYIQTFETAAIAEKEYSLNLFNGIVKNYENEGGDKRLIQVELAKYINGQTDSIILELDSLIVKLDTNKEEIDLKIFDKIVALRDTLHFSYQLVSGFPFSDTSVVSFKHLFRLRTSLLSYLPNNYRLVLLYSLRQDILKARSFYNEFIFSNMHDETLWCQFYSAFFYSADVPFFLGDKVIAVSSVRDISFRFGSKFDTVKINSGRLDASNINHGYVVWNDRAKYLGKNTVNGSITRMYKNDTISRPFSFSYFVSAPGIAFHLDKANVCYVGVPNTVSINVPGYAADKIMLRVPGAKVSKAGAGQFDIFISKMPAGKVYAYVDATNAQVRTSTVHSMELKLQELPVPLTNFEAYKENGIALADFKAQKSIQLFPADTAFAIDYSVVSFEVECINAGHQYTEGIEVKGADFETNVELQKLIASAQPGDRFIFSNIIAKATNGLSYEVLPVSVFIKDTP